jgi:tetratricopeptide (TPR) repeat protein
MPEPMVLRAFALALVLAMGSGHAAAQEFVERIAATVDEIAADFPPGEAEEFRAFLSEAPEGMTAATIGHLLYARRHFDRAAWFYGLRAMDEPADAAALSNFSVLAVQTHADAPERHPTDWLTAALLAGREAVALAPEAAAAHNALGLAARRLGQHDEAVAAHRRATEIAPEEPLYWTNLARALEAAGDTSAAAQALARAHALEPNGAALLTARADLPGLSQPYLETIGPQCEVDFRCQEICPRSIIGGIMSVTCEMANASAQMACLDGQPYPRSYHCAEEFPEYGILIPGLNSGFSIAFPGFSAHVLVDGQGNVDVRVEVGRNIGPLGAYLRADGRFSPDGGASFSNVGGGGRLSILPSSPSGQLASDLGHPPAHIELERVGDGPAQVNIEAYNAAMLSF